MRVIIVTGSVASGKTTISKKLAKKLNFKYIDVNNIVREYNLSESYDKKRKPHRPECYGSSYGW